MLIVEDEAILAEAVRDGLRREAIAADIAGDGDTALELLSINAYDIAVLDRDIPGPSGDEVAGRIVASGSGMPILMLTAADRLDDKATGFGLGADDYLTKPFELRELVLRLRALERRRTHHRPPVREVGGLRLDPFRREVHRDGRYVALTRKQFAVLDVLLTAEGGVVSAEELLEQAWDENADPFTNAVRITVSALRKRLGEPWLITTVAGVGHRIDGGNAGGDRDRAPGLSVRLGLTLSYAGFLMLAGALLLVAVWVFLLRDVPVRYLVPDLSNFPRVVDPSNRGPAVFGPAAVVVLAFLLVFGLVGGWILAGRMLAPLTRITDAAGVAANGSLAHRVRLPGRRDEFRDLADAFDTMLARLEAHVDEQRRFAANASHELRTPLAITQTLLDVARTDPLLLQMTTNLVHNAVVHNLPEQGIVWVRTSSNAGAVILTVENTGEKLTQELVSTLAEPFRRGTERVHTDHGGVGLGLAIVDSVAWAHGGTLTLTARPAGGLCVTVQLPVRCATRGATPGRRARRPRR